MKTNLVIASGRTDDDIVAAWLAVACDTMRTWDDDLESGDEFMTLDVQVATALLAFFKDDKGHVIETSQRMLLVKACWSPKPFIKQSRESCLLEMP